VDRRWREGAGLFGLFVAWSTGWGLWSYFGHGESAVAAVIDGLVFGTLLMGFAALHDRWQARRRKSH
jgi:hypothetical protein